MWSFERLPCVVFKVDIETMGHNIDTLHPLPSWSTTPWPLSMLWCQVPIQRQFQEVLCTKVAKSNERSTKPMFASINGRILNGPEVFHPSRAMMSLLLAIMMQVNQTYTVINSPKQQVVCHLHHLKKSDDAHLILRTHYQAIGKCVLQILT